MILQLPAAKLSGKCLQWKGRGSLQGFHDKRSLDVGNTLDGGELVYRKALVIVYVVDADFQQEGVIARNVQACHDCGYVGNRRRETFQ